MMLILCEAVSEFSRLLSVFSVGAVELWSIGGFSVCCDGADLMNRSARYLVSVNILLCGGSLTLHCLQYCCCLGVETMSLVTSLH